MHWIDMLTENFTKAQALIVALVGFVTAVITAYRQIKQTWETRARERLKRALLPLIAEAEKNPLALMHSLVDKPDVNPIQNDGKNMLVAVAIQERDPKLVRRAGIKDPLALYEFISDTYQFVKPVIKAIQC